MKKIVNKSLQTALLRGAVLVSGSTATAVIALFIENIYGVLTTLFLGAAIVVLIDEQIVNNLKYKTK
jgi:hypothetical protein